ncbi:NADPH-dependent 1-acyldihydroxyacetone phosphate reductase [Mycena sanguinolenta]|uniref:NADPH-dependent 1-acyldihydroxyacetone phosphate reductase n=1 Tax=Mycena sanguinolenta TaxID=230812 RepID=A0A8H6XF55_9AGAR|nr:NADPH-dependent 1-acyldihydroxyacetone phosphate reductase [Mycena sanguinolenta]
MTGPVVLVTGCSSGGIGYALCERFAAEGCRVYATARRLEAMSGLAAHPLISLQTLDVTVDEDVHRVIAHIVAEAGQLDIIVNNAGFISVGPLIEQPLDNVKANFDANTYGTLRVAKAGFPHMAARRSGLIVNIGSVVAEIAVPWNGLYSASKAAVRAMSDILHMELKPFNIKVMYVAPVSVRSNISNNEAAKFSLPQGSLYSDFLPNIIQRMNSSQANSMPAEKFAREVVRRALKNPPRSVILGGTATIFKIFGWLPRGFVLWYLWRMYSQKTT